MTFSGLKVKAYVNNLKKRKKSAYSGNLLDIYVRYGCIFKTLVTFYECGTFIGIIHDFYEFQ